MRMIIAFFIITFSFATGTAAASPADKVQLLKSQCGFEASDYDLVLTGEWHGFMGVNQGAAVGIMVGSDGHVIDYAYSSNGQPGGCSRSNPVSADDEGTYSYRLPVTEGDVEGMQVITFTRNGTRFAGHYTDPWTQVMKGWFEEYSPRE